MKIKSKVFASVMILLVAVVMLVAASVAWFTISTSPEIKGMQVSLASEEQVKVSADGENWDFSIDLSENFGHLAPLKPVSTVDGLNWFLPEYNEDGSLKAVNDFELDDKLEHANSFICRYDEEQEEWIDLEGDELIDAKNEGYYVYTDFYLKFIAEEEDRQYLDVQLSVPNSFSKDDILDTDGTYVLQAYELENETLVDISNDAQNIVRVGFLVNPDYSGTDYNDTVAATAAAAGIKKSDYSTNQFYIYEPNADMRTDTAKPITHYDDESIAERYIADYDYQGATADYSDGYYYETLPIEKTNQLDPDDVNGTKHIYASARITPNHLISQKHSEWEKSKLLETFTSAVEEGKSKWWSSKDVKFPFGSFLDTNALYNGVTVNGVVFPGLQLSAIGGTGAGLNLGSQTAGEKTVYPYENANTSSSSQSIITLKKDKPVRIRLFIWLEGQDIDCWNDVAAGGFVVNLELGGYTHETQPKNPTVIVKSNGTVLANNAWTPYDVTFEARPGDEKLIDHYEYTIYKNDAAIETGVYYGIGKTISEPGSYSVKFNAVTPAGEISNETEVAFNIIKPPEAVITVSTSPNKGCYPAESKISAELPGSLFESDKIEMNSYKIDNGSWITYTENEQIDCLDGTHTYSFRTKENRFGTFCENSVTVTVEGSKPIVTVSAKAGDEDYTSGVETDRDVVFTLSANNTREGLSYTYYVIDNSGTQKKLDDRYYIAKASGTYSFIVESDFVGTFSESDISAGWIVKRNNS